MSDYDKFIELISLKHYMKIQQLISDFRKKQSELSQHASRASRGEYKKLKNPPVIRVPDLADLVLSVINCLATALPEANITPYKREDVHLKGGYYKIRNSNKKVIGRLSCKLGKAVRLFYSCADGNTFGTEKEFGSLSELITIINEGIDEKNSH